MWCQTKHVCLERALESELNVDLPSTQILLMDQLQSLMDAYDASELENTFYSPQDIQKTVSLSIQDEPMSDQSLLKSLATIVSCTPKTSNPSFFNQLFGGKEDVAVLADMMVARMNNSMYTYKVAGPHILIEQEVLSQACSVLGYENGEGVFCPGGSIANLIAMILARNSIDPNSRDQGLSQNGYVAYTSEQGHYSIKKNAGIIGIGRNNVREIAVNESGEMSAEALSEQLEWDLAAGLTPFFLNLTAGTTVLGAFDDVARMSDIANQHKLWVHVDGSYGASVLLSKKYAVLLRDVNLAHSVAWNPHKMMGVPLTSSMLLCKNKGLLANSFSEVSDYLFQEDTDELNPGIKSIQCGRRNDAFKVWALWKQLGNKGFSRRIEKQFYLRDKVVSMINSDPDFELIMEPVSLNVCFRYRDIASDKICSALDKRGLGKVGHGSFNQQHFIRMVIVNPNLALEDLENFLATIKRVARTLKDRGRTE